MMTLLITKVIPIMILIIAGYISRETQYITEAAYNNLKKIVIKVVLPSVLFLTFLNLELKREYLLVTISIFIFCYALYLIGVGLNKIPYLKHPLLPFVMTAFTFGFLGIALYGPIFGMDNIGKISLLGIGHELFVWFIYITLLQAKLSNKKIGLGIIKDFCTSPLIIAVVSGLIINMLGMSTLFRENPITLGLYNTLDYVSKTATPLILIIVGYGLKINKTYIKQSVKFLIIRYMVIFIISSLMKIFIIDNIMENDPLFDAAYFTFMILPPPLSLSVFVGEYSTKENQELINNTVVLNTCICIIIYLFYIFVTK